MNPARPGTEQRQQFQSVLRSSLEPQFLRRRTRKVILGRFFYFLWLGSKKQNHGIHRNSGIHRKPGDLLLPPRDPLSHLSRNPFLLRVPVLIRWSRRQGSRKNTGKKRQGQRQAPDEKARLAPRFLGRSCVWLGEIEVAVRCRAVNADPACDAVSRGIELRSMRQRPGEFGYARRNDRDSFAGKSRVMLHLPSFFP